MGEDKQLSLSLVGLDITDFLFGALWTRRNRVQIQVTESERLCKKTTSESFQQVWVMRLDWIWRINEFAFWSTLLLFIWVLDFLLCTLPCCGSTVGSSVEATERRVEHKQTLCGIEGENYIAHFARAPGNGGVGEEALVRLF